MTPAPAEAVRSTKSVAAWMSDALSENTAQAPLCNSSRFYIMTKRTERKNSVLCCFINM